MEVSVYEKFPDCAKEIREAVFVKEQGFQHEFDSIDDTAVHLVMFDEDGKPAATCRVFWDEEMGSYAIGRLAVVKKYRGRNIGADMVREAERYVKRKGGKDIILHAQCRAKGFYKKMGFAEFGDIENDEGCPHIWMKKVIGPDRYSPLSMNSVRSTVFPYRILR